MKFNTYDIEGEGDIFGNRFVNAAVFDGKSGYVVASVDELLDMMEAKGGVYYAHYGADYDVKMILKQLLERYNIKVLPLHNKLSSIKIYKKTNKSKKLFELRDSQFLMPQGLKYLAVAYGLDEQKQDIDRSKISSYSKEQLDDYVISDARILHKLLCKFMVEAGTYYDKTMKQTLPSIAFADWKTMFPEILTRASVRFEAMIRQAYYGGRVDVFRRMGDDLFYYDVNSMFPFEMLAPYPSGIAFKTLKFIEDRHGIYLCDIDASNIKNPQYPLLPFRQDNKLLFPTGHFRGTYTSIELNKAVRVGYKFKVVEGIAWANSIRPFDKYVTKHHAIKQKSKGAKRQIAKLKLNSLYGKFGQHRTFKKFYQGKLTKELIEEKNVYPLIEKYNLYSYDYEDKTPFTRAHIAAFVTSYARLHLYSLFERVASKGGKVFYCDTDSIVCDVPLDESNRLGGLELEHKIKKGIFLLPKVYVFVNDKNETVIRAKGFNTSQLNYDDFVKAFNGDFSSFKTTKPGLVGFLESVKRGMEFNFAINRKRHMQASLHKRIVCADGIDTVPIDIKGMNIIKDIGD